MSTFKGFVEEFPHIRIDYFRQLAGKPKPLVYFLSHVHSDHLQGLESAGGLFIYCSPATRELLLGIEKYPHRMNLERGILERRKQHYKHLKSRLRTIPLGTPTAVEVGSKYTLRVTLLDANHCVGAVMFLIEHDVDAILYTGDIRSEPWWVNSLVRNPVVLPYCHGHKRLHKIYLDTTFAGIHDAHRKFPTKADGISELLDKVYMYPKDTVFHFHAWTLGYEDVWIALSSALNSQVHVDDYKHRLYSLLAFGTELLNPSYEGVRHALRRYDFYSVATPGRNADSNLFKSALFGFPFGNGRQLGCLTNSHDVRLHSCEHGTSCPTVKGDRVVEITPIISRSATGEIVAEIGAGGGAGDLNQCHEIELDSSETLVRYAQVCSKEISDKDLRTRALSTLFEAFNKKESIQLTALHLDLKESSISLAKFAHSLATSVNQKDCLGRLDLKPPGSGNHKGNQSAGSELPRNIQFPYSRHSSYEELCNLVMVFNPKDVYPCTIDENNWDENYSVRKLFGHLCSSTTFAHDQEMLDKRQALSEGGLDSDESQIEASSTVGSVESDQTHRNDDHRMSLGEALSGPQYPVLESQELQQCLKRRRLDPPKAREGSQMNGLRKHDLAEIRTKFNNQMKRRERNAKTQASTRPDPNVVRASGIANVQIAMGKSSVLSATDVSRPNISENIRMTSGEDRYLATNAFNFPGKTHTKPIELSDANPPSLDDELGEKPFDEMPGPANVPAEGQSSQSELETQVSLSDAAFESQSSNRSAAGDKGYTVERRKAAYKAVKERTWEDHGLVSSFDGHGEEELEL